MRWFGTFLICVWSLWAASPVFAQDDDKTYLEGLLQDALSGAGRAVTVSGFEGALSSNATLDELTIADEDGVWLVLKDASLVWSRSALLRGRLEVEELTAASIDMTRLPKAEKAVTVEDTEATPFALPDLPVSVSIGMLGAAQVRLGPDVLGEAAVLSLTSSVELADGAGEVKLDIRRTDRDDKITLDAGFSNTTRVLRIGLDFDEAAGGLVSRLMRIPGQPKLRLQVTGDAPIADFTARVALSSEDVRRFGGQVAISALEGDNAGYRFGADLNGDLRPLVTADLHPFFGEAAVMTLSGTSATDGRVAIERLALETGAMQVAGALSLAADGWPDAFSLTGRIGGEGRLRLPMRGPETHINVADFSASFDAAKGEAWRADLDVDGLNRDGLRVASARLGGSGTITRGASGRLTADLGFRAGGVTHDNNGLARALGSAPEGRLQFEWQNGAPVEVGLLSVTSGDAGLVAEGRIDGLRDGYPVSGRASLRTEDLRRFASLAGRDMAGAANVTVEGMGTLLGGIFDIELAGSARDLAVGEPRVDPLLKGSTTLNLAARRNETGSLVDKLVIDGQQVRAEISAKLSSQSGALVLEADLDEIAKVEPRLSGPARIAAELDWQAGDALNVSNLRIEAAEAEMTAKGILYPESPELAAMGRVQVTARDLSRLSALAGRDLAGRAVLNLEGTGELRGQTLEAEIGLEAQNFRSGMAQLDGLIAGDMTFGARLGLGNGVPFIERLTLAAARLSADASSAEPGEPVQVNVRLADLGVLAPGISGPARVEGTLTQMQNALGVRLNFSGPGGAAADITGEVRDLGRDVALAIDGNAPLALANDLLKPQSIQGPARFSLRLDGPPALSSLSGQISTSGTRVALPGLRTALNGLAGAVTLRGGQAQVDITGNAGTGGRFHMTGPVTLSPPFNATLRADLTQLGVRDAALYETTLNGFVTVDGPLRGGARIGGAVQLGRTELRVPSGGRDGPGAIPDIRHVNEPAAVRQTRRRAGLIQLGRSTVRAVFPIDLVVVAPNQIFVRGRGLDAELGGTVRLGGTSANVTASGTFELIRGRMDILSRRIDLVEGLVDLRGALDPFLRFVARTESDDITVDIVLEGLASEPEVRFTSSPDLPQEEIIAQLLFGRSFGDMSAFQAAQLVAAVATLSGHRAGGLTGRLRNSLGVSDVDITTSEGGATEFSVGTYISDNIYSEVTADSDGNNQINLNLDLTSSVTVKGGASSTGDTGLGVFFEKDY